MPEFENMLDFAQKLRLAVAVRKPYVIGTLLAQVSNDTRHDPDDLARIYREVEAAVLGHYGPSGVAAFRRAYLRRLR